VSRDWLKNAEGKVEVEKGFIREFSGSPGAELALTGESASSLASGLDFRSFPIPDRSVPSSQEAVAQLVDHIIDALHAGKSVALHCRQSIGRSAMIAAAALISGGQDVETAVSTVRRSRGLDVPETHAQRKWISDFSSRLANQRTAQPSG
jgi:protein-tyrosine phosphatase